MTKGNKMISPELVDGERESFLLRGEVEREILSRRLREAVVESEYLRERRPRWGRRGAR